MAALSSPSSEALLEAIAASEYAPVDALHTIASHHLGKPALFRQTVIARGDAYFPHPADVRPAVARLFQKLDELWARATNVVDDLHIAAFAARMVLAIHPYEDGNARTAMDLSRLLLMWRWNVRYVPLSLGGAQPTQMQVLQILELAPRPQGPISHEAMRTLSSDLARQMDEVTVHGLREDWVLHAAAMTMLAQSTAGVRRVAQAHLPRELRAS